MLSGEPLETQMDLRVHSAREAIKCLGVESFHGTDDKLVAQSVIEDNLLVVPSIRWEESRVSEPFLIEEFNHSSSVVGLPVLVTTIKEYECVQISFPFVGNEEVFDLNPFSRSSAQHRKISYRWAVSLSDGDVANKLLTLEMRTSDSITSEAIMIYCSNFRDVIQQRLLKAEEIIVLKTERFEAEAVRLIKGRRERYMNIRALRDELRSSSFSVF